MNLPKKLKSKLLDRDANNALRQLSPPNNLIDFSSNDYLGFSISETLFKDTHQHLLDKKIKQNGSTGSRLLSGNHPLYGEVEAMLCKYHKSEAALIFNSGYDANIGFFSSMPQREDIIFYDEYVHASIRDGISMSNAKAYKFKHNDLKDLKERVLRFTQTDNNTDIYVVTESVFSMDGDSPDLAAMTQLCQKHNALLIVDEAHAFGVFGDNGVGLIQMLRLEHNIFARLITFGKALGCHGAAILGSPELKKYLINFARSFIYTTALPPHALAAINTAYHTLPQTKERKKLHHNIKFFKLEIKKQNLQNLFIESHSAIHCCIILGNERVKTVAKKLQKNNFCVMPVLSPTVPKEQERLRFCLHSYNSEKEISAVLKLLSTFVVK